MGGETRHEGNNNNNCCLEDLVESGSVLHARAGVDFVRADVGEVTRSRELARQRHAKCLARGGAKLLVAAEQQRLEGRVGVQRLGEPRHSKACCARMVWPTARRRHAPRARAWSR